MVKNIILSLFSVCVHFSCVSGVLQLCRGMKRLESCPVLKEKTPPKNPEPALMRYKSSTPWYALVDACCGAGG